ncbi:MAG TPA: dihydroxy-acid dehydratase, partial [Pyrinomonadaceae bacterium]
VGGPLALVRNDDVIELDVADRTLDLIVDDDELTRRRAAWRPQPPKYERGFGALYSKHVLQADLGCDFDFLLAGAETPEPEIHH